MTLAPWDYLFVSFNSQELPGPLPPDVDRRGRPAGGPAGPLQRPDAGAPPPPAVPRDVGVAVVDRAHHVQPDRDRGALRLRLLPRAGRPRSSASGRWSGSASCASRRCWTPTRRGSPASATTRSRSSRTRSRRSGSAAAAGPRAARSAAASASMPIEIARFGVGHRRPDGPPGTRRGQEPAHPLGRPRASISELAFARDARVEPHTNPNTTWMIVIEGGGWVAVGDERTRVAAGEAVLWPADVLHAAWTEHSEMRAIVVEFAGPDDAGRARAPRRPGPRRQRRRPAARPAGRGRRRARSIPTRRATSHGTANRPERATPDARGPAADEPRPGRHLLR